MTKLWRVLVVTMVVMSLLIQVALLTGTASALPFGALFTGPDGSRCTQPCLFGIRPGETTVAAAAALLPTHPLLRGFRIVSGTPLMLSSPDGRGSLLIVLPTAKGLVKSVSLSPGASFTAASAWRLKFPLEEAVLGDVIAVLGAPDAVVKGKGMQFFAYINTGLIVSTGIDNVQQAGVRIPVTTVELVEMPECAPGGSVSSFAAWSGLRTVLHYPYTNMIHTKAVKTIGVDLPSGLELCRPAEAPSTFALHGGQVP